MPNIPPNSANSAPLRFGEGGVGRTLPALHSALYIGRSGVKLTLIINHLRRLLR